MRDDGRPDLAGMRVEARIFLGIAAFLAAATAVYAATAYEEAGTAMLLLAAAMAVLIGGYLTSQARRRRDPAAGGVVAAYLPEASIWPFGLGVGLVLMLNGLALGAWAILPGAGVAATCAVGYARQSRRGD
jgi:hypothetical protein